MKVLLTVYLLLIIGVYANENEGLDHMAGWRDAPLMNGTDEYQANGTSGYIADLENYMEKLANKSKLMIGENRINECCYKGKHYGRTQDKPYGACDRVNVDVLDLRGAKCIQKFKKCCEMASKNSKQGRIAKNLALDCGDRKSSPRRGKGCRRTSKKEDKDAVNGKTCCEAGIASKENNSDASMEKCKTNFDLWSTEVGQLPSICSDKFVKCCMNKDSTNQMRKKEDRKAERKAQRKIKKKTENKGGKKAEKKNSKPKKSQRKKVDKRN